MPVIGILNSGAATPFALMMAAFDRGLSEQGYVVGRNVKTELRWADGQYEKLPELAAVKAVLVNTDPYYLSRRDQLAELAARYSLPTIYSLREHVTAGGLISYSANLIDAYRLLGGFAGRILRGGKPAEMPVEQPTKYELMINLKTAKALGLEVPPTFLARADEVIE
jgi:putative ABC transport system substrate-binding protein